MIYSSYVPHQLAGTSFFSLITGIWFLYTTQRDAGLLDTVCSHPVASSVTNPKCTGPSLFPWRYNPFWFYFHCPVAGFSLLVFEVS